MGRTYDVLAMGRSSIDLYAHEIGVPMADVRGFDAYVGGCPTNISVGAHRLGLDTALLTAVGDDQVGDFIVAFLQREGVDVRSIARKAGRRTSAVILTIQPPDRFPLTYYRDNCADRELTVEDVLRSPIERSAMVVVTGTGLSHEPGRSATLFAADRSHRAAREVFVDLDYRPDQWSSRTEYASLVQRLLRSASIVVGTEEEIAAAADCDDLPRASARLISLGLQALVVKRGAAGASIFRRDTEVRDIPSFKVEVLNVLGAGDAFASGLITGLRRQQPLERAVRMGNAAGAILVTRHGCANFMPTMAELEEFVQSHGGW